MSEALANLLLLTLEADHLSSTVKYLERLKVTEWPPIGKIAAHSAYDMFHGIST